MQLEEVQQQHALALEQGRCKEDRTHRRVEEIVTRAYREGDDERIEPPERRGMFVNVDGYVRGEI